MKATAQKRPRPRQTARADTYDVIVVGGGPAGSVISWCLARRGIKVLLIDCARFPREKVCGDYVEPRGLQILRALNCLDELEAGQPLPITHSATFVNSECRYRGRIPFYGLRADLPPHGYIISRDRLDYALLRTAAAAGVTVHEGTRAKDISLTRHSVFVEAVGGKCQRRYRARLVVGADGVNSVVARAAGNLANDPRHIALSQRAYATGITGDVGEAVFYFEKDLFPGYGWMFPMGNGRVNLGVGVLSETVQRLDIKVPELFRRFFAKLKRSQYRCRRLKLVRPPIGGIVKTYGGAGCNWFARGLLVGDAGSFVDPMTGEGITPAMESAVLAAPVIERALNDSTASETLAQYEPEFRRYFDPSMVFVDFCAAVMRNYYFADWWLLRIARGCEVAASDSKFARVAGACFGGLEIEPANVMWQVWRNAVAEMALAVPRELCLLNDGRTEAFSIATDWFLWQKSCWASVLDDPLWHAGWLLDLQRKWGRVLSTMCAGDHDPRARGLINLLDPAG